MYIVQNKLRDIMCKICPGILCTPKKALFSVAALIIVIIGLNSHYLFPSFGMLIPGYLVLACASEIYNASYNIFYYLVWNIIQMFTTCLISVCSMLGMVIDIFISIRICKQAITRNPDGSVKRDENLQKQMFFLITTLPLAIYRIISPRQPLIIEWVVNAVNNITILTWL